MKPIHYSALENTDDKPHSYCFRSDVWKPGDASTYEAIGPYAEMQALADKLNAELIERDWRGQTFTRYITNWYVTVDADEANRLCEIDHTAPERLRVTEGVQVIHNRGFAAWSDGKITKTISGAPNFYGIAPCASKIINDLRGSDTGEANLPGGMGRLMQIVEIGEWKSLAKGGDRGVYAAAEVEWTEVVYTDETRQTLYSYSEGYFEGYAFDVYANLNEAMARLGSQIGPQGLSGFNSEFFDYDPQLGYVKIETEAL